MKKVFTPLHYVYLTLLMFFVVIMLMIHLVKDTLVALFSSKSKLAQLQNRQAIKKKKSTKYIIKNSHLTNS